MDDISDLGRQARDDHYHQDKEQPSEMAGHQPEHDAEKNYDEVRNHGNHSDQTSPQDLYRNLWNINVWTLDMGSI